MPLASSRRSPVLVRFEGFAVKLLQTGQGPRRLYALVGYRDELSYPFTFENPSARDVRKARLC